MSPKSWSKLISSIVLCQMAGIIGSVFTISAIPNWFQTLAKPALSPPNWIFAPVWTILYTLMGISLYLIWQNGLNKKEVKSAINLFLIHLAANALWTIIFFGIKNLTLAFLEILVLLALIVAVMIKFHKINKTAAYLLIPYLIWVSFATYLSFSFWLLNK